MGTGGSFWVIVGRLTTRARLSATTMFYGEYEHTIDDKGRITIPAKFRAHLAAGVVLTMGLDPCLLLYPTAAWEAIVSKLSEQSMTKSKVRALRRQLLSGATDDAPDKQGRVMIPPKLLQYARIEKQAVIIGQYDYCEIWNPNDWEQRMALSESDPQARAAMFESLDL